MMAPRFGPGKNWHQRWLAWCVARSEWFGAAGLLGLVLGAGWWWSELPLAVQVLAWALGLPALVFLVRQRFAWLVGPVFFFDLVRTTRRGHVFGIRFLYGCALLGALLWYFARWFPQWDGSLHGLFLQQSLSWGESGEFAQNFLFTLLGVQNFTLVLLTPAYVAGTVSEEKELGTLDLLLTTHLTAREIVLGKLAARLGFLGLVMLTGLPVLSFTQFLGGVEPLWILVGFGMSGLVLLSLGSLSILTSATARQTWEAVLRAYFLAAAFGFAASICLACIGATKSWPVLVFFAGVLPFVAFSCCLVAINGLRTSAAVQGRPASGQAPAPPKATLERLKRSAAERPRVADDPIIWKELYVGLGLRPPPIRRSWSDVRAFLTWLVLLAFVFWIAVAGAHESDSGRMANLVVRQFVLLLDGLLFLCVALVAAGVITREREKQTLDSLLTTPLDRIEVLRGKYRGCLIANSWIGLIASSVWIEGWIAGGLHPLAFLLLALATLAYTAFAASLGMYFSTVSGSTRRAILATMLIMLLLGFGPMFLGESQVPNAFRPPPTAAEQVRQGLFSGLSPLIGLVVLSFGHDDFLVEGGLCTAENVLAAVIGLVVYAAAAYLLWRRAQSRFLREAGPPPTGWGKSYTQ